MTWNQELYDLEFLLFYSMGDLIDYSYALFATCMPIFSKYINIIIWWLFGTHNSLINPILNKN